MLFIVYKFPFCLLFFVGVLEEGLEGIFVVFVLIKNILSLLLVFFKFLGVNKVGKVRFKLYKGPFF